MNKPETPPMLPGLLNSGGQPATAAPKALVRQPGPVSAMSPSVSPTRPAAHIGTPAYVDSYLFEAGYYASRAEYEELSQTAASRIQLRADVENAQPKRRT